ncbi:nitrogen regulatory protein P-II family [Alkalispirillum mobile]|uniref:Nitrogen regulatory protein P-II family n=1 Tax=Alkalispirillum mobile TaxID=85925 RepID=A0A498C5H8_9GAMM|nr:hypothetical protein [Alkalispirillum mobile]RLK51065.1 nitrogen regulatory protein P-II family [Alkalispirillum mobile]
MTAKLLVAVIADELEERAIKIAREEGARGVTILSGRGIGFPERITFFGLTYRGLTKILLWVLPEAAADLIAERLNRELDLLRPDQGLAFVLPVSETGGVDVEAIRREIAAGMRAND